MRNILSVLSVTIIVTLLIVSCGQSNTKQKELELKEKELALKEKELALQEKGMANSDSNNKKTQSNSNEVTKQSNQSPQNETQKSNFTNDDFIGCWYWGDEKEGFAILNVKPNGILNIHRLDLDMDVEAGYKITDNKIIFTKNNLLMQTKWHLESSKNNIFLVEEYANNPGKFKKIDCNNNKSIITPNNDNICGLWKSKGVKNDYSGEIDVRFIKISKKGTDKLIFKTGSYSIPSNGKDNKSENDIYWENDNDVYIKISNNKYEGNFRVWQGSAPDAYYDTKFSIQLKDNKTIYFVGNSKDGGGNTTNEQFEAYKIK